MMNLQELDYPARLPLVRGYCAHGSGLVQSSQSGSSIGKKIVYLYYRLVQ